MGNIFKLATRFSEPLGARYLDEEGKEQLIWMGSYGIGPARIVAAAIEQFHDDRGIAWPRSIAPFDVELVTLGKPGEEARTVADRVYEELREAGLDTLYDDREASPGEKFADAELLGCPLRITIGRREPRGGGGRGAGPARAGEARAAAGGRGRRGRGAPRHASVSNPGRRPLTFRRWSGSTAPAGLRPRRAAARRCIRGPFPTRSVPRAWL